MTTPSRPTPGSTSPACPPRVWCGRRAGPAGGRGEFGHGWWTAPWFLCLWLAANAALLVSRVPTLALKGISVPPNAAPLLLILVAAAARPTTALPVHPVPADRRRLCAHHSVHGLQPTLGCRTPGDVGRLSPASDGRHVARSVAPSTPADRRPGWAFVNGKQAWRLTHDRTDDRPSGTASSTLTARLNTAALDSRRGVIRLHPEVIAALGIREWDAVSPDGFPHHRCGRRGGTGGDADRNGVARRRHTVQRGSAGGRHRRGGPGDRHRGAQSVTLSGSA